MKSIIAKAIFNSHSYLEYRKLISDLLRNHQSTGSEQSEALTHYSNLNETRMNRLDKTLKLSDDIIRQLQSLQSNYIWLVITEGWCGDAAQLVPIFNKMTEASEGKIDLKIVLRDENDALMNLFLTNKTRSIPKLIVINKETGSALAHWGPRPDGATDLVNTYKKKFGSIDETAKTELQLWYLKDKGVSAQNEIMEMMLDLDT
jgi:hypothetical protein